MRIRLRSARKLEIVRKIQEREKEGWECIAPIASQKHYKKDFDKFAGRNKFKGVYEYDIYFVYMRRVSE